MNAVQLNAKAIAAAVMVLLVALLRVRWPDIAQGDVQEALRTLIELAISAAVVWAVPNKTKETGNGAGSADGRELTGGAGQKDGGSSS